MATPNIDKDIEQLELSDIASRSIKWCSYFGKKFLAVFYKVKCIPILGLAVPSLCIYSKEIKTYVHTNIWKQTLMAETTQMTINMWIN